MLIILFDMMLCYYFTSLRMTKRDKKKIEKMEKEHDHCDAESSNVKKMSDWMKKHNKDYYTFYFIEGIDYKEIK